jgi:hypothetical protein
MSVPFRFRSWWPLVLLAGFGAALFWEPAGAALSAAVQHAEEAPEVFRFFSPFSDPRFTTIEQVALLAVLAIARLPRCSTR